MSEERSGGLPRDFPTADAATPQRGKPASALVNDIAWQAAAFRCLMANVADAMVNHETWTEVGRERADQTVDWTYNYAIPYGSVAWNCVYMANCMIRLRDAYAGNSPKVAASIAAMVGETP